MKHIAMELGGLLLDRTIPSEHLKVSLVWRRKIGEHETELEVQKWHVGLEECGETAGLSGVCSQQGSSA